MKEKYLISAHTIEEAKIIARENNIQIGQYVYVPLNNKYCRKRKLDGRRVSDEKYLIGPFSEEEKRLITLI